MIIRTSIGCALLLGASLTLGCGKDKDPGTTSASSATPQKSAAATASAATTASQTSAAAAGLTPDTIDPNKVYGVAELKAGFTAWQGKQVTVGGHLWLFMGDEEVIGDKLVLGATPDADKDGKRVECLSVKAKPSTPVKRTDPLVVKGTYKEAHTMWKTVQLEDCEVVSSDKPFDANTPANPLAVSDKPIPAQKLFDAGFGWKGKAIQVTGKYWGSTYSSASDEVRHDLQGPDGETAVGCNQKGNTKAPKSAVDQREGVIMKGTIDELSFDAVSLKDCTWVNRS